MVKCKRYPLKEQLLHQPDPWDFQIDSLIAAAYNSDENGKEANKPPDLMAPANSVHSLEEIDF